MGSLISPKPLSPIEVIQSRMNNAEDLDEFITALKTSIFDISQLEEIRDALRNEVIEENLYGIFGLEYLLTQTLHPVRNVTDRETWERLLKILSKPDTSELIEHTLNIFFSFYH